MGEDKKVKRPGGELSRRPLHFFFILDSSGSMIEAGKIEALNNAIRETLPHMKKVADENPFVKIFVRELKFGEVAQWVVTQPTPLENFKYVDLQADGGTPMGKALSLVAEQLKIPPMENRAVPPVLLLVSDGQPTDDFESGLRDLMSVPWGKKSVRLAIAIGDDADTDVLRKFINNPEIPVLEAHNPEQLIRHIKLASTSAIKAVSAPPSKARDTGNGNTNVEIPEIKNLADEPSTSNDIW